MKKRPKDVDWKELELKLRSWAAGHHEIHELYIYGSYIKHNSDPDDIDIAIRFGPGIGESEWILLTMDLQEWIKELAWSLGIDRRYLHVEPVDSEYTPNVSAFVEEKSICVYGVMC